MRYALVSALGLLVFALVSPIVSASQTQGLCANVIVPQMQQAGLDVAEYATVLGCEQNSNLWIQRTVAQSQDDRWPVNLDDAGHSLMQDVDDLSVSDVFSYSVRFDRATSEIVTVGAGGSINRTDISDQLISTGPNWLNNYVDDYARDIELYLLNTAGDNPELIEYIQWFMARRDATLQVTSGNMNPMSATAFLSNWGYMQWPWPWQLADPHNIVDYIATMQPQPTQVIPASGSNGENASLTLAPTDVTGRPGETVTLNVNYPPLQGIHSVAFMVYSEKSFVSNVPMALVDTEGDFACTEGSTNDIVRPVDRAVDLTTLDYPPNRLDIEISNEVAPGDRLAVCVEMVGFSLDREVFAWNARIDIKIAS